jgi:hypothetical protein
MLEPWRRLARNLPFAEAAKQFIITPARRSKLVVTRIDTPKREQQ